MESVESKIVYVILTRVVKVEERIKQHYISGVGKEAKFSEQSLGWYALLEHSYEALYLGMDKPHFSGGDNVKITIEKQHETATIYNHSR